MGRGNRFFLIVAAALLSSAAIAHADTTYTVTPNPGDPNILSGSITGTGMTVTSFDLTAVSSSQTFTFDSADAGSKSSLLGEPYHILSGAQVNEFYFGNSGNDALYFDVTGDFTSGLTFVFPQTVYLDGGGTAFDNGIALMSGVGQNFPLGNLTLTADVATTPEPSSWLLMATGLVGLCILGMKRHQFSQPSIQLEGTGL